MVLDDHVTNYVSNLPKPLQTKWEVICSSSTSKSALPSSALSLTFDLASDITDPKLIRLLSDFLSSQLQNANAEKAMTQAVSVLIKSWQKVPPLYSQALNIVKLVSPLMHFQSTSLHFLHLVVNAIASVEAIVVPPSSPQNRNRMKVLSSAYRHAMRGVVAAPRPAISAILDIIERFSTKPYQSIAALGIVSPVFMDLPTDDRERILIVITSMIMKAGALVAERVIQVAVVPLQNVSKHFIATAMLQIVDKALLREPEAALGASSYLFRALPTVDLSSALGKSVIPALIQAVKSADATTRSQGMSLADALRPHLMEVNVLKEVISSLLVLLASARYTYQRVATIDVITSLCCNDSMDEESLESQSVYLYALIEIQKWLSSKKERNEESRSAGIRAVIVLLSRSGALANDTERSNDFESSSMFLSDILNGKYGDCDRRALLLGMTINPRSSSIHAKCLNHSAISSLRSIVSTDSKTKNEDALRSVTILSNWTRKGELSSIEGAATGSDMLDFSSVLVDQKSFATFNEVQCALRCYQWMVESDHKDADVAIDYIFKLCLDDRWNVSTEAISLIRRLTKNSNDVRGRQLFTALWNSQFHGAMWENGGAGGNECTHEQVFIERLGKTLLAAVLPRVVPENIPLILLASNHPRLCPDVPSRGRFKRSRYWSIIERKLEEVGTSSMGVEGEDWLEQCLSTIFGEHGLKSEDENSVAAAINALSALADERNPYSRRVLRRSVSLLRPLALGASCLSQSELEALKIVEEAKRADVITALESVAHPPALRKRPKKHNVEAPSNSRMNQQKQAEVDRARAAAATVTALAEKAEAAGVMAKVAATAIRQSRVALLTIQALSMFSPAGIHDLTSPVLSMILPSACLDTLEGPCRSALFYLTNTSSKRLSPLSMDIAFCLYGLENNNDVQFSVAGIILSLKDMVPPVLSPEDFSLVALVIRAALLNDPEDRKKRNMHGRRANAATDFRSVAIVKAAAEVLREHCKAEAFDSAVVAAAARAGSWAVHALEREDIAFSATADALGFLTETILTPGTDQISQLLEGMLSGKSSVRYVTLSAIARLPQLSSVHPVHCPRDAMLGKTLWLARFDPEEDNALLGDELWENYTHPLNIPQDIPGMLALLTHCESDIRVMCSSAIATSVGGKEHQDVRNSCISNAFDMYLKSMPSDKSQMGNEKDHKEVLLPPKRGRENTDRSTEGMTDSQWIAREGVALLFERMAHAQVLAIDNITAVFSFLAKFGLGDSNDQVRAKMSQAATAVVEAADVQGPSLLLPMIELHLNTNPPPSSSKEKLLHGDRTRENLVMCLGAVASFLPRDDDRIVRIADQVMKSAMETPSEVVQNAAARCLSRLADAAITPDRESQVLEKLRAAIWDEKSSYGERRGASYVLAGIIRGLGLKFMNRIGIMREIESGVAEKSARRRQGAFVVIETCAIMLGRLFEPYAVASVPLLLSCMGDAVADVRNSCWAAAQSGMVEMSSQGVKMILPSLLVGLKDRQWRTKAGSAEVLGAMAFCAPRQLAQCLPQVVPMLADALSDAHPRVVSAAESAINRIAAVVRSPDVRNLSPFLLASLRDPANRTRGAIDAMLGTDFKHAIDAASLALLIPSLYRGLRDRNSELKKRSAAIVGSMCNNVSSQSDVLPYLDLLLPALRATLFDSIPEVRQTSARAIGALSVSLGEEGLPNIVPWLVNAVTGNGTSTDPMKVERAKFGSDVVSSSVERSGAAMGLAEVAASMSEKRLDAVITHVLGASAASVEAKEGSLMFISHLPRTLGEHFEGRLSSALSAILLGLSDDSDSVREAALSAGRSLVSAYAKTSLEHLLPEILSAMREKLWRIRQAATQLLGDMLLSLAGANQKRADELEIPGAAAHNDDEKSSNGSDDEESDDEEESQFVSPEQALVAMSLEVRMSKIEEVLGFDRRNEVLAALYIIRCDVSIVVRQTGVQVWKTVVSNTPRVLREIMPSAVRQIVDGLGDEDEERRAAAGKALGELSQKLGDRVVPEVLPALRAGIADKNMVARIRKGACEGLGELVLASPQYQIEAYSEDLIDATYDALCDVLPGVRKAAAEVFSLLLKPLGVAAVDAVIPLLIKRLSEDNNEGEESSELALDGLRQILMVSGSKIMSHIVPQLLVGTPISQAQAQALAVAAVVGEEAFEPHIVEVVDAVIESIESMPSEYSIEPLEGILAAVARYSDHSTKQLLSVVFRAFNDEHFSHRVAASRTCGAFCRSASKERVSAAVQSILEVQILQLADTNEDAAVSAWEAMKDLSNAVSSRTLSAHIPLVRQCLRSASISTVSGTKATVHGLQIPQALAPFVPLLTEGLLYGSPELREQAALAIGDLVELTNPKSLKPYVIKLTGPLIRVMSDRFPWQVKAAILRALLLLLREAPAMLRTFAPQLQSTFVKCLSDDSRLVRGRACAALGSLSPIQARVEALLNDLVALGSKGANGHTRAAAFQSCSQVFRQREKIPSSCFSNIPPSIVAGLSDQDENVCKAASQSLGIVAGRCNAEQYRNLLDMVLADLNEHEDEPVIVVYGQSAIGAIYLAGFATEGLSLEHISSSVPTIQGLLKNENGRIRSAASTATADFYHLLRKNKILQAESSGLQQEALEGISGIAEHDAQPDVRIAALTGIQQIIELDDEVVEKCAHALVVCAAEAKTGIRNAADQVLRRAFITQGATVLQDNLMVMKRVVVEEDWKFVKRRVAKLCSLPSWDEDVKS